MRGHAEESGPFEQPAAGRWAAEGEGDAPPPFLVGSHLAVPMQAASLDLTLDVNAQECRATGRGRLRFVLPQPGRPLFDLVPRATAVRVDGAELPADRVRLVLPPDETTPLRMLDAALDAGEHVLELEYAPGDGTVQFAAGGAQVGFFMTDLDQRGYLERHAPANLEFDQVPMTLELRITGSTTPHQLFTNGTGVPDGATAWRVEFPDYFTSSSIFVHLTDRPLSIQTAVFDGAEREILMTAYGAAVDELRDALKRASEVLKELEETYGPYAHRALLIYCTGAVSGGMEYAGATMTSLAALGHEITHSWFARGVMPGNGNAGWIDEAIARWRDLGYPRAAAASARPPVNLAGFSPYRRHTPALSYAMGSLFLSELDRMFAPQGLRPLLATLFQQRKRQVLTTAQFQAFLEAQAGMSLAAAFDRYVYGKEAAEDADGHELPSSIPAAFEAAGIDAGPAPLPHGFTLDELRALL